LADGGIEKHDQFSTISIFNSSTLQEQRWVKFKTFAGALHWLLFSESKKIAGEW